MPKVRASHHKLVYASGLAALLIATPVYAHTALAVLGQIFLRVALDSALEAPRVAPAAVPVVLHPDPEVLFTLYPGERLKDQHLDYRAEPSTTAFRVRDFRRSFYTLLGGSAKDATQLVQEDELPDPALIVGEDLALALSRHYGSQYAGLALAAATPAAVSTIPGAALGSGFTVEVTTTHWEMKAVSINPVHIVSGMSHYGVYYDAKFRVLDHKDGSALAEGKCDAGPDMEDPAPTYDEALADGGKRLKELLVAMGHKCALNIEYDYLGIRMPQGT